MLLPEPVGATQSTSRPASCASTTSAWPGLNTWSPKTDSRVLRAAGVDTAGHSINWWSPPPLGGGGQGGGPESRLHVEEHPLPLHLERLAKWPGAGEDPGPKAPRSRLCQRGRPVLGLHQPAVDQAGAADDGAQPLGVRLREVVAELAQTLEMSSFGGPVGAGGVQGAVAAVPRGPGPDLNGLGAGEE